eukprot:TRINITY_DN3474_c0_g1_i5.p1 TRINITY_DN3474_c0_g1~~TRINITY_DN3474_c0_g1_i5.p1  ORF type:complete len:836 (-),score=250.99 TRINITY_DN3474_c0_g1_i5:152-2659(-)
MNVCTDGMEGSGEESGFKFVFEVNVEQVQLHLDQLDNSQNGSVDFEISFRDQRYRLEKLAKKGRQDISRTLCFFTKESPPEATSKLHIELTEEDDYFGTQLLGSQSLLLAKELTEEPHFVKLISVKIGPSDLWIAKLSFELNWRSLRIGETSSPSYLPERQQKDIDNAEPAVNEASPEPSSSESPKKKGFISKIRSKKGKFFGNKKSKTLEDERKKSNTPPAKPPPPVPKDTEPAAQTPKEEAQKGSEPQKSDETLPKSAEQQEAKEHQNSNSEQAVRSDSQPLSPKNEETNEKITSERSDQPQTKPEDISPERNETPEKVIETIEEKSVLAAGHSTNGSQEESAKHENKREIDINNDRSEDDSAPDFENIQEEASLSESLSEEESSSDGEESFEHHSDEELPKTSHDSHKSSTESSAAPQVTAQNEGGASSAPQIAADTSKVNETNKRDVENAADQSEPRRDLSFFNSLFLNLNDPPKATAEDNIPAPNSYEELIAAVIRNEEKIRREEEEEANRAKGSEPSPRNTSSPLATSAIGDKNASSHDLSYLLNGLEAQRESEMRERVRNEELQKLKEEALQQVRDEEEKRRKEEERKLQLDTEKKTKDANAELKSMKGFLSKLGHVVKNWQVRYFAFRDQELMYFTDATMNKLKGRIPLHKIKVHTTTIEGRDNAFVIRTLKEKNYYVCASSKEDRQKWINAILFVSKGVSSEDKRDLKRTEMSGWAWKKPETKKRNWKRRWFLLKAEPLTNTIAYFESSDNKGSNKKGDIMLAGATLERSDKETEGRTHCVVIRTTKNGQQKGFLLSFEGAKECDKWFEAIDCAIKSVAEEEKQFK